MSKNKRGYRVLIVDDEPSICELLSIALRKDGYDVETETSPLKALELVRAERFDAVIEDLKMPEMDGITLLGELKKIDESLVVIIMTAYATWDRAVEAMRLGAYDYIRKPFDTKRDVRGTLLRALNSRDRMAGSGMSFDEVIAGLGFVVGYSRGMKTVRDLIERAAPTDSTVLVHGESGTGKELVARSLHAASGRADKPFVAVNCGALTETLLESELFGHTKGSFTGAVGDKTGLVEVSDKGTLFLDEISEMSPQLQVKMLRLLEEKEFKPVGSVRTKQADVRFVTATNRDLEAEVARGTFRKDLFYRLNVIPVYVPPLRERRDDIPVLAEHFLKRYGGEMGRDRTFSDKAKETLMVYSWPGNIRELENTVQRAVALSEGTEILSEDLFEFSAEGRRPSPEVPSVGGAPSLPEEGMDLEGKLAEMETGFLREALERSGGNHTRAARLLGLSPRSFRYKMAKYRLSD